VELADQLDESVKAKRSSQFYVYGIILKAFGNLPDL